MDTQINKYIQNINKVKQQNKIAFVRFDMTKTAKFFGH